MSGDDRSAAPPHELVGPLGQVIDPGGGFVPGLAPTPVPGALGTASPGLAAAAIAPDSPVSGPDDPRVIALAIERIAGELLGGTAAAPVPLAPATEGQPRLEGRNAHIIISPVKSIKDAPKEKPKEV